MSSESQTSQPDSECESSQSKKKAGRPKGSKTQQLDHVIGVPPGCPRCNSTEFKVLRTPSQRSIQGTIQGQPYNRVTWRRCKCHRCDSQFMMREYRLV